MAFKNTCETLKKVADNEPIFVLRVQDVSAPAVVQMWVNCNPNLPVAKLNEA